MRIEQLITPVHGGPQRLLPQRRGPVARVEQLEPVAQPVGDLLDRQGAHPGRGQLDAERDAVQRAAQPGHRRRVVLGQGEAGPGARGPGGEQADGLVGREFGVAGAVGRQVERRHPPDGLAPDPQRLPAGRDDPQPRAPGQQQLHERGAVAHLVLAGVQDQQHAPRAQRLGQRLRQRNALLLTDPDGGGDLLGGLAVPVGQLDQPGLVQGSLARIGRPRIGRPRPGTVRLRTFGTDDHVAGQPHREAGLADTTGTAEGQRADLAEEPGQLGKITLTTDKAVRLRWQVAAEDRGGGLHWASGDLTLERGTTRVSHRICSPAA